MTDNTPRTWALTDLQVYDATFIWKISNFKNNIHETGEKITSPTFEEINSKTNWCLSVYPKGKSDSKFLSLSLSLMNDREESIKVKYQMCLLNEKEEVAHKSKWTTFQFSKNVKMCGHDHYMELETLFKNENFLPNESLIVMCEMKVDIGVISTVLADESLKPPEPIFNDYKKLWLSNDFGYNSDITLVIDKNVFSAHKVILSARSNVFREMIEKCADDKKNLSVLVMTDCNYKVMYEVLRYIYYGEIENFQLYSNSLLAAAEKFNLQGLKSICENELIKEIDITKVVSLLTIADLYKAEKLKTKSIEFIVERAPQVIKTKAYKALQQENPQLIAEIFNKMVNKQKLPEAKKQKKNSRVSS